MTRSFSNYQSSDFPLESLRLMTTCPICNTQYNPVAAKIVEEREQAHLIHIQCKNCGSSIVAVIMIGGLGISTVGLICDLTSDDVFKFKDSKRVSTDDVISIHQILTKNSLINSLIGQGN